MQKNVIMTNKKLYFCVLINKLFIMKRVPFFLFIFCITILFVGCKKKSVSGFKVENFSNGKAGEIILVMDKEHISPDLTKQVVQILQKPQPAINQVEPMFDILKFNSSDFNSFYQKHRNIVHFDINADYAHNTISFNKDVWSSPQVYVHIKGNNTDSCYALFVENEVKIINLLYDNDLKRLQLHFFKNNDASVELRIKEKFGIQMSVPQQYFIAREETDFIWLRFKTTKNDRFILVYRTPVYELSKENLIKTRDLMTKMYIPGAVNGSYPKIAQHSGFPIYNPIQVKSKNGMELRGLWESVGDYMGGPFYSFTFVDAKGTYCVTIDGFVYAPEETKRDFLREVEAIVKSVR